MFKKVYIWVWECIQSVLPSIVGVILLKRLTSNETAKNVGTKIRQLRIKSKLTQEELAHKAELHTTHLGQIERGERNPTLQSLEKIAAALNVDIEQLFLNKHQLKKSSTQSNLDIIIVDEVLNMLDELNEKEKRYLLDAIRSLTKLFRSQK